MAVPREERTTGSCLTAAPPCAPAGAPRPQPQARPMCRMNLRALAPETVGHVRQLVRARLRHWNTGDDLLEPVLLCLSELLSNVVRHDPSGSCVLTLENGPALRLVVRDSSSGLPEARVAEDLDETGRGLLLIGALASRWGAEVTPSGKDVWVEFDHAPGDDLSLRR